MRRIAWIGVCAWLAWSCGGDDDGGASSSGGKGGKGGTGGASGGGGGADAALPPLVSEIGDCAQATGPCLAVDLGAPAHTISPDLFGDGIEWTDRGQNVLAPDPSGQTPGSFHPDVMKALGDVGFTVMRYPGGTLSDLFHWNEATGPVSTRKPQSSLMLDSTNTPIKETPLFGPDEFSDFANQLGAKIVLTVNVATGTSAEAAGWISYWKGKGVVPAYVEIGNELYLSGPGNSFPVMDAAVYAQKFDEFVAAIRAVDPTLRCGAIGTIDTASWCYPSCSAPPPWNQIVLQAIKQKADFFAIHNAYAPGTTTDETTVYESMLGYPEFIRFDDKLIEDDIDLFASTENKTMPLAKTEFASYFLAAAGSSIDQIKEQVSRNQTWAAALYSGLVIQTFIPDPRLELANHINPLHYLWQAPIALAFPDLATYPNGYEPTPTLSAYGLVFKAYRELAGQRFVAVTPTGVPTMSTQAIGVAPALNDVPLLDAVAALNAPTDAARGWIFAVNRSLTSDLDVALVIKNIPSGAAILEVEILGATEYTAKNVPGQAPMVEWKPLVAGKLPAGTEPFGIKLKVPKHSLVRARVHG